ncbi:hypothetical protein [Marinoscillum furvescens]|uniref:Lipocalin-like protein n=1 Tax=Marinoscillum furvescens DSM 4134 TaxID=1122208 RepID=A0A3D9L6V8_MARFU|nr:hypothetical protein [Marinoscillum furvescens]REE01214.1 hypothetical protein C7460_104234 [Marinoscillum furvescens DSM 4134]
MKSILNYLIIAGMAVFAISCAEVADPSPTNMSYGDWEVEEVYVNGQADPNGYSGSTFERLTLERDGSFILVDNNELIFVGNWVATETSLTLTSDDGSVFDYQIVYQTYEKLHLLQTISSPTAGEITIRYLMNKDGNATTY